MYFTKYANPANFRYLEDFSAKENRRGGELTLTSPRGGTVRFCLLEGGVARIILSPRAASPRTCSVAEMEATPAARTQTARAAKGEWLIESGEASLRINEKSGDFALSAGGLGAAGAGGENELCGGKSRARQKNQIVRSARAPFGVCGAKSIVLFDRPDDSVVYGLGEKTGALDKSGRAWKMWNTDAAADFPSAFMEGRYDPAYVSIPFFISKYKGAYYGALLDTSWPTFFHTDRPAGEKWLIPSVARRVEDEAILTAGVENGPLALYLIPGPSLRDVVRRLARLTGRHEMPPLWALGYHQCRWGYASAKEIRGVASRLARERIPVAAMWMDIDYMNGFRVFTFNEKRFSAADRGLMRRELERRGTRLVAIVDPGIKAEAGYGMYEEGVRDGLLCQSPEGKPFIGYVWPGVTAFPDFTLEKTRKSWAGHIKDFLAQGPLDGIWNDMNDPSVGQVEPDEMLFEEGRSPHAAFHNAYGHLMAQATWEGFREKDPMQRPFILTRSGSAGTQRYSAIWTGDNASNEANLAMSIPMSINMALSGVSFNGPDVGGFAGNTTESLMTAWMLAGALFPFFRNHSAIGTRSQEPYAFSAKARELIRKCILTRAKLLPYLYNQFFMHWRDGEAVMRPLSYEFEGREYERLNDQFMIGPSLMLAPFTDVSSASRRAILPPGWWFDLAQGRWVRGGRSVTIRRRDRMIVFVRDGSILPCVEGTDFFPQPDFSRVEFHVFAKARGGVLDYYEDDGATRRYQQGEFNQTRIAAGLTARGKLDISARREVNGYSSADGAKKAGRGKKAGGAKFTGEASAARCWFYGARPAAGAKRSRADWPFVSYPAAYCEIPICSEP